MSILDFTDEDEIIKCPDVKSVAEKLTHWRVELAGCGSVQAVKSMGHSASATTGVMYVECLPTLGGIT